ncbi:MAG: (Fe-S)-binding protein, partial [Gammaproteobacteria bacterium]
MGYSLAVMTLPTERAILGLPGRFLFGLLLLCALLAFVYSIGRRIRVLLAAAPEPRFDRIGLRIRKTLEFAFAQKRMFRDLYAGVFHIFLFAGFVVLTVRTLALVV